MARMLTLVLTLILAAGACSPLDLSDVPTDHQVGQAARAGVSGDGPALGLLTADWQVEADLTDVSTEFQVDGGTLLAFATDGVTGFDATTGKKAWHYREPGRTTTWSKVTGGAVLLRTKGEAGDRLVALDSGTGRLLWERDPEPNTAYVVARGVLVQEVYRLSEHKNEFTAFDARTGDELWNGVPSLGAGCQAHLPWAGLSGDGSLVVMAEECSGRTERLHGLDPAGGDPLWSLDTPSPFDVHGTISVVAGSVVISPSSRSVIVLGRDGVRQVPAAGCDRCRPVVAGDQVAWRDKHDARQPRVTVVNVRTGAVKVVKSSAPSWDLISDGRRLYGRLQWLAGGAEGTPRHWATVIDPITGSSRALPVHNGPDHEFLHWAGTAGGRLITTERHHEQPARFRLTAYRSIPAAEPLEYGGVDPRDWPDCAELLAAVPGKRRPGSPDTKARSDDSLLREAMWVPFTCRADIAGIGRVRVTVLWVTKRPQEADALLDGKPETPPDADEIAEDVIRVGRVIVQVEGSDEAERAVVKRLRSMESP
ncbi:PQQ-binding-like beta-propeller repeat protein [Nonomuraea rubra]|uniref:Pyrrolo-quinoline quinone repeat domain-containing protein n=1 Tax=Nonomuraea rubra TaxID=46180 RepID=A0A7X0NPL1_9ACTN|nr:PQQ-binding-like beta-propeller repeat protein [Nonomuraea rubra]MBB6547174.1 hypothetical protein [Nonomuraea rubra]